MANQTAKIEWRNDMVPVSSRFDDPYYSIQDGIAETRHVFLQGNNLPDRFFPGFHVAELGFGTGLNMLCSWDAWKRSRHNGPLKYTSFEQYPMDLADMAKALAAFPEIADLVEIFLKNWKSSRNRVALPGLDFELIAGDARTTLAKWPGRADAWYLDGFSPAKNPEMWTGELLTDVGNHTCPGGTCATYSAAGHVRQSLMHAGFRVERQPGFGRKRHMTVGQKIDAR